MDRHLAQEVQQNITMETAKGRSRGGTIALYLYMFMFICMYMFIIVYIYVYMYLYIYIYVFLDMYVYTILTGSSDFVHQQSVGVVLNIAL